MTPMDDVLEELVEARQHAGIALDILEKRRDLPNERDDLRATIGALAAIINRLSRERDRWRPHH